MYRENRAYYIKGMIGSTYQTISTVLKGRMGIQLCISLRILTCITVDQLQNERSTGNNAWSSWKEVPDYHKEKGEGNNHTKYKKCKDYRQ